MIHHKIGKKFVLIDSNKNKYLLKTVLYTGDSENHCDKCFLDNHLCEEAINITGDCADPYVIFTCVKTKKHTHESKT